MIAFGRRIAERAITSARRKAPFDYTITRGDALPLDAAKMPVFISHTHAYYVTALRVIDDLDAGHRLITLRRTHTARSARRPPRRTSSMQESRVMWADYYQAPLPLHASLRFYKFTMPIYHAIYLKGQEIEMFDIKRLTGPLIFTSR